MLVGETLCYGLLSGRMALLDGYGLVLSRLKSFFHLLVKVYAHGQSKC